MAPKHFRDYWLCGDFIPDESVLGVLYKFAYQNSESISSVVKCLLEKKFIPSISKYTDIYKIDCYDLLRYLGLNYERMLDYQIQTHFRRTSSLWISDQFRFCPVCLEAGYHSVVHQFLPLKHCRLHDCRLVTYCQSCGCEGILANLIKIDSLSCSKCGGVFSGAEPNFHDMSELYNHRDQIEERYLDIRKWIESYSEHEFDFLWPASVPSAWQRWCNPTYVARSLAANLTAIPQSISRELPIIPLFILRWRSPYGNLDHEYGEIFENYGFDRALNKALRVIEFAIFGNIGIDQIMRQPERAVIADLGNATNFGDPKKVAYFIFRRLTMDNPYEERGRSYLSDYICTLIRRRRTPLLRIGVECILFATYAGIYNSIIELKKSNGVNSDYFNHFSLDDFVTCSTDFDEKFEIKGAVFFPDIPWLTKSLSGSRVS